MPPWFALRSPAEIASPALMIYRERLGFNLETMLKMVSGQTKRLMPHVKTHKMSSVVNAQVALGITAFKSATIAEAEMCAKAGAKSVLLAYQAVGPNRQRLLALTRNFPKVSFSSLVDNELTANDLNTFCLENGVRFSVYIDVDTGMQRTGFPLSNQLGEFYTRISRLPALKLLGFHLYDGHLRNPDFAVRQLDVGHEMEILSAVVELVKVAKLPEPLIIAGGTPTFSSHSQNPAVICSPGTCVFWDWGYGDILQELNFKYAAVLLTRVISKPVKGKITIDLGHKAVAAENPIDRRFKFLNLENYRVLSQSEEHGVIEVENWESILIGQELYAVPYHICPTVALHHSVKVIENGEIIDEWKVTARDRQLTI